jgi:phosphotransferase system  glucose/maltose/N-acetylglucosamine-specific IIC component
MPERGERAGGTRDEQARGALAPLGANERPAPLLVAVVVCALLAVGVIVGVLTVHDLSRHGGSVPGGVFLGAIFALLAQGIYRRRYWAVLGFEAVLAFQLVITSLALVVASSLLAAALCVVSIGLGGWLFWKLIRVMGRIQAGERERGAGRAGEAGRR